MEDSIFKKDEYAENGNDEVIKLNGEQQMVVDIASISDLLNSIRFATSKLEDAKKIIDNNILDGAGIKEEVIKLETTIKNLTVEISRTIKDSSSNSELENLKNSFEKVTEKIESLILNQISKEAIINVTHQLEKLNSFDKSIKKIKALHIVVTAFVTFIVTVGTITITKIDDTLYKKYLVTQISDKNYLLAKNKYQYSKQSSSRAMLIFKRK